MRCSLGSCHALSPPGATPRPRRQRREPACRAVALRARAPHQQVASRARRRAARGGGGDDDDVCRAEPPAALGLPGRRRGCVCGPALLRRYPHLGAHATGGSAADKRSPRKERRRGAGRKAHCRRAGSSKVFVRFMNLGQVSQANVSHAQHRDPADEQSHTSREAGRVRAAPTHKRIGAQTRCWGVGASASSEARAAHTVNVAALPIMHTYPARCRTERIGSST